MKNPSRPLLAMALLVGSWALVCGVGCSKPPPSPVPEANEKAGRNEMLPASSDERGSAKEKAEARLVSHDWPQMRGPEQTGVSREKNLPESFSPDETETDHNLLWKQPYGGRTTPIVMNGRVYVINPTTEGV